MDNKSTTNNDTPKKEHVELTPVTALNLSGTKKKKLDCRKIEFYEITRGVYSYSMGNTSCIGAIKHVISEHPRSKTSVYNATLWARYIMLPGSCTPRAIRQYSKRRTIEINNLIARSFAAVLPLHLYPNTQIYLLADMVALDGGSRCAAINCLSYALKNSKLPYVGLPIAIAFGLDAQNELVMDLNYVQDSTGLADCPVVFNMPTGKIINMQMQGTMTRDQFIRGLDESLKVARQIYAYQKD